MRTTVWTGVRSYCILGVSGTLAPSRFNQGRLSWWRGRAVTALHIFLMTGSCVALSSLSAQAVSAKVSWAMEQGASSLAESATTSSAETITTSPTCSGCAHGITSARRSRSRVPTSRRCARPERHAGHRIQDSSRPPAGVGTPYPARPQHREMLSFFLCTGLGILRTRLSAVIATKYGTPAAWLGCR